MVLLVNLVLKSKASWRSVREKGAAAGAVFVVSSQLSRWLLGLSCLCLPVLLHGQADSLRSTYESAYEQRRENPDWRQLARACQGDPDCLAVTETWTQRLNDTLLPEFYEYVGDYFTLVKDADTGIAYFHRGLQAAERLGLVYMKGILHNRLGYTYTHFKTNSDSSAFYLYKSVAELDEVNANEIWQPYYNLAYLNDQLAMRGRALEYMEQSYLYAKKAGRRIDYGYVLYHLLSWAIGDGRKDLMDRYFPEYNTFMKGARSLDPQHDALLLSVQDDDAGFVALREYEKSLVTGDTFMRSDLNIVYSLLGAGYQKRGEYTKALKAFNTALVLEQKNGQTANVARNYLAMSRLGKEMDRPDITIKGMEGYQRIRDSLTRADYQTSISRLEVEFETQKTEAELARSELALSEARRQRTQLQIGGGALAILLLGGFFFYQNRLKLQRLLAEVAREEQGRKLLEVQRQAEVSNLRSLIEGQEMERTRVAKDLHDGLGGLLTTVKAHVASIPNTAEAEILIDRACTSVRRIAHNMVPQTLAQSGLSASLGDLAAQLRVQGYDVDLEVVGAPEELLGLPEQSILLRIAQELTHNVVKHAEAKQILLQLFSQPDRLLLTVEDDGKGFNLEHARQTGSGMGLGSIEQRVAFLEGKILFDSRPGKGTTVSVELPVP